MEYNLTSFEVLKMDVQLLNARAKEDKTHLWQNLIRIEQLKRNNTQKKDAALRRIIQCSRPN